MSAYGTKRTLRSRSAMSAFGSKADIEISGRDVRYFQSGHVAKTSGYCSGQPTIAGLRSDAAVAMKQPSAVGPLY
jgi:hypothetical protein